MPHTYFSICGGSAVGKIRLIKKLLADEGNLRKRFRIDGGTVDAFGAYFSDGENKRDLAAVGRALAEFSGEASPKGERWVFSRYAEIKLEKALETQISTRPS